MKILLLGIDPKEVSEIQKAKIQALVPDMQLLVTEDETEIMSVLPDIEIAARRFPHHLIMQSPSLRWVQQWGAGADWLLRYPEIQESDVILTNASGIHAIQITEHIFACMLAFARQLHLAVLAQTRHDWRRPHTGNQFLGTPLFELAGKTMLLIGVGAIGARTAQVAETMGMRVLGIRRNSGQHVKGLDAVYGPERLYDLIPEADFVVLTVPHTAETAGMIGEKELEAMKSSAYLINIGRGGTIQEDKLVMALEKGWIAGAGLDVFETEPLDKASPLWDMKNVIITAHYAGLTPVYEERATALFLDNLERYKAGMPLKNVVDKQLGY